ncbi:integrase DNA-binding domain-containing protein [Blautia intestinalis]
MARKKRTDSRGRVLKVGESQNKDGRYCYRCRML